MSLTREQHLEIVCNKLVLLGLIDDPEIARNPAFVESCLIQQFRKSGPSATPWQDIGQQIRLHREKRLGWTRNQAIEKANKLLFAVGDQGIADHTALCRIESGQQRITYLQACALEQVFGLPFGTFVPWMGDEGDLKQEGDQHG
ncbi:MAG: hypothetical protein AAGB19_03595 [Cyanobacteria bacterium P01_F01_bin.3]